MLQRLTNHLHTYVTVPNDSITAAIMNSELYLFKNIGDAKEEIQDEQDRTD